MKKFVKWTGWPPWGALLIAIIFKGGLLYANAIPFNADEAVVGLMARHILQGERPIFFYGQAYLGSLDAWLIAGAFALFGQSVLVIRLVQAALYLGTIFTTYQLGLRIYSSRWIAGTAAVLLAIPTVLVTLYTTATLGGYGEVLLLGNILFLLALRLGENQQQGSRLKAQGPSPKPQGSSFVLRPSSFVLRLSSVVRRPSSVLMALLGLLSGLGFWGFALIVVYLLPIILYLLFTEWTSGQARRRVLIHWLVFGLGFSLGAAPWLWFTLTKGLTTLTELGGSAISGASPSHPVFAAFAHLFNFLLFGPTVVWGLRPPWSAQFLALPLVPVVLAIHSAVLVFVVFKGLRLRDSARAGRWLLFGSCVVLTGGFIFTSFGADPSGRYFVPLAVPWALFTAEMLHTLPGWFRAGRWLAYGPAFILIAFNTWGTVQSAVAFPPGLTTQFDPVAQVDHRYDSQLIEFLRAEGETRGYGNYWVEFPLAFLSNEELIYAARLPYHLDFRYTARDNRYLPYSQAVDASPRVAYITTHHPPLDERLRNALAAQKIAYSEKQIGDYHLFYHLSRRVTPDDLDLYRLEP
jgi:4-amino-4-deoxy-L-arabinose transferase-like glycosyltransferase